MHPVVLATDKSALRQQPLQMVLLIDMSTTPTCIPVVPTDNGLSWPWTKPSGEVGRRSAWHPPGIRTAGCTQNSCWRTTASSFEYVTLARAPLTSGMWGPT